MTLKYIVKRYWVIMVTVLVLFFWLGFFVTENLLNNNRANYIVEISSNEISVEDIDVDFFLDGLRKSDGSYSYASVSPKSFFSKKDIEIFNEENKIIIKVKAKYFVGTEESIISVKSETRFNNVINKVLKYHDSEAVVLYSGIEKHINPFTVSLYSVVSGFLIFSLSLFFIRNTLAPPAEDIYKSGKIFKYPFSKLYWKCAFDEVRNIKIFDICLISILFALQLVMKFISVPSGFANLSIGLTYLIFVYIALIYGPIWGLIIGFGSDIIGFLMHPTTFHPGYTIQAMLTGFVYGLCFYKTDLSFSKTLLSRIIVNILLNGVFGAFLWGDFAGLNHEATMVYMGVVSLPKNILYLFPQAILLYLFLRSSVPLLIMNGLVPREVLDRKKQKSLW